MYLIIVQAYTSRWILSMRMTFLCSIFGVSVQCQFMRKREIDFGITFFYRRQHWTVYWDWLQPYFSVCDLLPSTFLALLTDFQLIEFLKSEESRSLVAIDAVLSCADFHVMKANEEKQHVSDSCYPRLSSISHPLVSPYYSTFSLVSY